MGEKNTVEEVSELFYTVLEEVLPGDTTKFDEYRFDTHQFFVWPSENWTDEIEDKMEKILRERFDRKVLISCLVTGKWSL